MKQPEKRTQSDQARKFIDAAREVGASEDPQSFDRVLKRISKAPPPDTVKERKKQNDKKPVK